MKDNTVKLVSERQAGRYSEAMTDSQIDEAAKRYAHQMIDETESAEDAALVASRTAAKLRDICYYRVNGYVVCHELAALLRLTSMYDDLKDIRYEVVGDVPYCVNAIAEFESGAEVRVDITADSDAMMIYDIVNALTRRCIFGQD